MVKLKSVIKYVCKMGIRKKLMDYKQCCGFGSIGVSW